MKHPLLGALAALALLAIVTAGCSQRGQNSFASALTGVHLQPSGRDSTPGPPPGPPPKPPIATVVFLGADTIRAGSSGVTHWQLGNGNAGGPLTMDWTLTSDAGWPGFPISGSMRLPALQTRPLDVVVPVPASAFSGTYGLLMTVHTAGVDTSSSIAMASGFVLVYGNDGPPPPPPPPFPAIEFMGPDSVRIGANNFINWQLGNQSDHAFTMSWTAQGPSSWGFPFSGSVSLGPQERQIVSVSFDVPDSVAVGSRWVQMTVTRPDGLPDESLSSQVQTFRFPQ
jgi:hypothetical protein